MNGDGIDDILVLSRLNDEGGENYGQAYLFFGRESRWDKFTNLSEADASFIFENNQTADYGPGTMMATGCVGGVGDVNGDGFDDFILGAAWNNYSANCSGKVYLFFGRTSGWKKDASVTTANASIVGKFDYERFGTYYSKCGDVNGDGFDDFLISQHVDGYQIFLVLGRRTGWEKNLSAYKLNAAFDAEYYEDRLTFNISPHGAYYHNGPTDLNGDGYHDIIIRGKSLAGLGNSNLPGKVYIFFGRPSAWYGNVNVSTADVIISGRLDPWLPISSFGGVGDVNGDGFDDLMTGWNSGNKNFGEDSGMTYLIFGKASGWEKNAIISDVIDASFHGEQAGDRTAYFVGGHDANADGFDDLLIMSMANSQGARNAGKEYLIFGKATGWTRDKNISSADVSFLRTADQFNICAGAGISGFLGDVNGDGYDDFFIASYRDFSNASDPGQIYLFFPEINFKPHEINSVKTYADESYTREVAITNIYKPCYVELTGEDGNSSRTDTAFVTVVNNRNPSGYFRMALLETGNDTGIYRGYFRFSNRTNSGLRLLDTDPDDDVTIRSEKDPTKYAVVKAGIMVKLWPPLDNEISIEDKLYTEKYLADGYNTVTKWTFRSNASWLSWDAIDHIIYGTPDNSHVGRTFWADLNITDGLDNYDEHNFTINVWNMPPDIITNNVASAMEDQLYSIDYNSSDDGRGEITWYLDTDAGWLDIDNNTGELSGTPTDSEKGSYWVNVQVHDGNGGWDKTNFSLTVYDTNDAPVIVTEDNTTAYEDALYYVDYEVVDIDDSGAFTWYVESDAVWLKMDSGTGVLSGTPENSHVGTYYVNITVQDKRGGSSSRNFSLEVINTNDAPEWPAIPDAKVREGEVFTFDVNATDVDADSLYYFISSNPVSDITIDPDTGHIEWKASLLEMDPPYVLEVRVSVSDGMEIAQADFGVKVIPNVPPTVNLLSPLDKSAISYRNIELEWEGGDLENDPITYDLYIDWDFERINARDSTVRRLHRTNLTSYNIPMLVSAHTYYWTVIPFDGLRYGECLSGVFSFYVNTPPTLPSIPIQNATAGIPYSYDINAVDNELGDEWNFVYSLENAPEGMTIDPESGLITWNPTNDQAGKHTIKVLVTDGKDQVNTTLEIIVTKKEAHTSNVFTILVITTTLSILAIMIGFLVVLTEVGKYKFFSYIYAPMYNKLQHDRVLDQNVRNQIHGYIQSKPGENYSDIKKALNLKNGILAHHLRVLQKEELVRSRRDHFYTRFYPAGVKEQEADRLRLNKLQKKLIEIIHTQPGITQHEIINLINRNQKTISYNLTKLVRADILEVYQQGREKSYYVNARGLLTPRQQAKAQDLLYAQQTGSDQSMLPYGTPAGGATGYLPPVSGPVEEQIPEPEPVTEEDPENVKT